MIVIVLNKNVYIVQKLLYEEIISYINITFPLVKYYICIAKTMIYEVSSWLMK